MKATPLEPRIAPLNYDGLDQRLLKWWQDTNGNRAMDLQTIFCETRQVPAHINASTMPIPKAYCPVCRKSNELFLKMEMKKDSKEVIYFYRCMSPGCVNPYQGIVFAKEQETDAEISLIRKRVDAFHLT